MCTSSGKYYLLLFIFATLQFIPLVRCANPSNYVQWDLAVAHENRVMVVSRMHSDSGSSLDLSIQMPKPETEAFAWTPTKFKPRIEYLATDPDRGLIFFNHVSETTCSIALFDLKQNSTHILIQTQKTNNSINGLAYHQNCLFWTDNKNRSIMRLNTTSFPATLPPPEQIVSLKNQVIGLTVHPTNNWLFWASWSPAFTASKIYSFDIETGVMKVAMSELTQPHSVVADENYLYWIDEVEGIDFHIERVALPHFTDRQLLHRGQHQAPTSLAILSSSKLVWTDIHGKAVHELDLITKQTTIVKQFKTDRVFGIASFSNDQQNISNDAPYISPTNTSSPPHQHKVPTGDKNSSQDVNVQQPPKLANPSDEKILIDTLSSNSSSNVQKKDVPAALNSTEEETVPTNSSSNKEKINDIKIVNNSSEVKDKASPLSPNSSSRVGASSLPNLPSHNNNISNNNNKKNNSSSVESSDDRMEWCGDWESIPCLNGASCLSVNRKIFCLCVPGFSGPTCGDTYEADDKNRREVLSKSAVIAVVSCLIGGIVIMTMVIIYLALRVKKLNKKPKIHKKIVVAKSRRGDRNSSSVCEMIDIENCCNMNVCETPCYDPIGPTTSKSSKSSRKKYGKDDDKERLIDS